MGYRAELWGYFYLTLALTSSMCMAWAWSLFTGGGKDCKYTCPLLTQDSDFLNARLLNQTCDPGTGEYCCLDTSGSNVPCKYINDKIEQSVLAFAYCTSKKGVCMQEPVLDAGSLPEAQRYMYLNRCKDASEIQAMDIVLASSMKCMYCDETGSVFWPSIKVAANNKWIPTVACGEKYENAGLESADAPVHSYTYGFNKDIPFDNSAMGAEWFAENKKDLHHYPYCESPTSMGWDNSAIDMMAPTAITMLMLLCIFYTIMAFLSLMVGLTFYRFKGKYQTDWGKLKYYENWCACCVKKMQPVLRVSNTMSIVPIIYFFYLICILGVCDKASNEYGEKTFFPQAVYFSFFTIFALTLNCIGGTWFRRKFPVETAFYIPMKTYKMSDKKSAGEVFMKHMRNCWKCYNKWGGP